MPRYVDGFVIPIPKRNLPTYRAMARKACRVWMEHGALEYRESVGDDLKVKGMTSFTTLAKCRPSETVCFSWIVYRSKAHRDKVNAKVMKDPRILAMMSDGTMPFDVTRMAYGGFSILVDAGA